MKIIAACHQHSGFRFPSELTASRTNKLESQPQAGIRCLCKRLSIMLSIKLARNKTVLKPFCFSSVSDLFQFHFNHADIFIYTDIWQQTAKSSKSPTSEIGLIRPSSNAGYTWFPRRWDMSAWVTQMPAADTKCRVRITQALSSVTQSYLRRANSRLLT